MAEPLTRKPLAAAEAAVRHLLLQVGFGAVAFAGGMLFVSALMMRLQSRVDLAWGPARVVLAVLVDGGWVLAVLPAIAWLAARFMELKPWSTGLVGAASGLFFQLGLQYVSLGEEGIVGDPVRLGLRVLCVVAGVCLTAWAVNRGRATAQAVEAKARAEAEAKKHQYDEFVKQAEALAERREQVPIVPAPPENPPAQP